MPTSANSIGEQAQLVMDRNGLVVGCNDASAALFRIPCSGLVGQSFGRPSAPSGSAMIELAGHRETTMSVEFLGAGRWRATFH